MLGRSDDNIESLKKRMVTFLEQSKPVIEEYEKGGKVKVIKVDASKDIETVWASTKEQIKIL